MRELERKLTSDALTKHSTSLELFKRVLSQKRSDSNKIYSLHEPHVQCISKGKEHKKYEFGNKVSLMITKTTGVIVGALSLEKYDYDGHTLQPALEQYKRFYHLKNNHRLGRNYYSHIAGDQTNVLLSATAYNFKRMMRKWKVMFKYFLIFLYYLLSRLFIPSMSYQKLKMTF